MDWPFAKDPRQRALIVILVGPAACILVQVGSPFEWGKQKAANCKYLPRANSLLSAFAT